jgi:hypothetical protein
MKTKRDPSFAGMTKCDSLRYGGGMKPRANREGRLAVRIHSENNVIRFGLVINLLFSTKVKKKPI